MCQALPRWLGLGGGTGPLPLPHERRRRRAPHPLVPRLPQRRRCGGRHGTPTRTAAAAQPQLAWRPPGRATTTRAAAGSQQQHVRQSPRHASLHGDRSATTRRTAAAVHPHQGLLLRVTPHGRTDWCGGRPATTQSAAAASQRQVCRPPRLSSCGGRRAATARAAAAAQQHQVRRPSRRSTKTRAAAAVQRPSARRPQRNK